MTQAAEFVRANPGCAILPVAEAVGPHGSRNYGYRTVHRAIKAGMIRATGGVILSAGMGDDQLPVSIAWTMAVKCGGGTSLLARYEQRTQT